MFGKLQLWPIEINIGTRAAPAPENIEIISPPENDSFRKDLSFSPDVFFPTAKSPRYVADWREILHDGHY